MPVPARKFGEYSKGSRDKMLRGSRSGAAPRGGPGFRGPAVRKVGPGTHPKAASVTKNEKIKENKMATPPRGSRSGAKPRKTRVIGVRPSPLRPAGKGIAAFTAAQLRARAGRPVQEDEPGWDWRTMGNKRRGPAKVKGKTLRANSARAYPSKPRS